MIVPRPETARLLRDDDLIQLERELAERIPNEQRLLAALRREKRRRTRYAQRHPIGIAHENGAVPEVAGSVAVGA
ncbi:hypothetical protein J5226_12825 [Lysobacter sp. K5869]|uniref:hypothetical protein n=1 Tax=Lysobacter sp. K5869 TaxID=2820808 RepID=UPI001C0649AC|nr:hypothetical protein [Lysobacter sp. K5869]QWP79208.1 hypothetical protein J5226_12825 [Lysobacter sp. K5869]